jgi:uncharacterized protein (TIGR02646 family)
VIYIAKHRGKAPKEFLDAARDEMKIVLPLFARAGNKLPKYKFKAYRNQYLKKILEQLFQAKCAYCEAPYNITGSMEVEHYRPKSLYYWLAADWSNLLPSCNHCNNGKRSKFPLRDPQKQAKKPGQEKREDALLLNPSDPRPARRPERHLTFNSQDGSIQAVAQRGAPSPLGSTSIDVYRLTHAGLSNARRDWATRLRWHITNCQKAMNASAADREFAYEGLKSFLGPEQPFKALTLQILRETGFKAQHTPKGKRR